MPVALHVLIVSETQLHAVGVHCIALILILHFSCLRNYVCNVPTLLANHDTVWPRGVDWSLSFEVDSRLRALSVSSGLLCNFVAVYSNFMQFILQLKLCLYTVVHLFWEFKKIYLKPSIHNHYVTQYYFGRRSFTVAAPMAWNALSAALRSLQTVNSFKAALKTFLFSHTL